MDMSYFQSYVTIIKATATALYVCVCFFWFLLILLDLKDKAPEEGLLGQVIIEFIILIAVPPVSSLRLYEVVHFYQHCTRASDAPYIAIVKLLHFFLRFVRNGISV